MKKGMWIVTASVVALLAGVVGVNTLLAQSEGEVEVSVWRDSKTILAAGPEGLAEALREAVNEGAITQEAADRIVQSHEELTAGTPPSADDEVEVKVVASAGHAPKTFSVVGAGGLADALQQAVDDGVIAQETADKIVQSHEELTAGTPPSADDEVEVKVVTSAGHAPKTFSVVGAGGLAEAIQQAADEGVISRESADQIIQSFEELRAGTPQLSNGEEMANKVKISVWHAPVAFSAVGAPQSGRGFTAGGGRRRDRPGGSRPDSAVARSRECGELRVVRRKPGRICRAFHLHQGDSRIVPT